MGTEKIDIDMLAGDRMELATPHLQVPSDITFERLTKQVHPMLPGFQGTEFSFLLAVHTSQETADQESHITCALLHGEKKQPE